VTLDVPKTVGQDLDLVGTPFSVLAENLLLLRDVEYLGQPHRVVTVLKMRASGYDRSIRQYEMVPGRGIQVLGIAPATAGQPTAPTDRPLEH
jgi:circadian clock protein KaiC